MEEDITLQKIIILTIHRKYLFLSLIFGLLEEEEEEEGEKVEEKVEEEEEEVFMAKKPQLYNYLLNLLQL